MLKSYLPLIPLLLLAYYANAEGINLSHLHNYANQPIPQYITKDNTSPRNPITDEGATLGRVLFYDTKLSVDNTVSCASCHKQENAFSDPAAKSEGVAGLTTRHSPRLINARFGTEHQFRWDKTATSLEAQMTKPIRDKMEMGYSGDDGSPSFDDLITELEATSYYPTLFKLAFGDETITEIRMQMALAQFVRSIQSFDTKYDIGRAQVTDETDDFPNFTAAENAGKRLFTDDFEYEIDDVSIRRFSGNLKTTVAKRTGGGLNCATCHTPPEFDIDPESLNNGFVRGSRRARDFSITRSPTLRDLLNPDGALNGPMFHGGTVENLVGLKAHYNFHPIDPRNTNLDPRMAPEGKPQFLDITRREQQQLVAFLKTLTGTNIYQDEKWSDPFSKNGELSVFVASKVY